MEEIRREEKESWENMSLEEHMDYYEAQGKDRKEAMKLVAKDRNERDVSGIAVKVRRHRSARIDTSFFLFLFISTIFRPANWASSRMVDLDMYFPSYSIKSSVLPLKTSPASALRRII